MDGIFINDVRELAQEGWGGWAILAFIVIVLLATVALCRNLWQYPLYPLGN